MKLLKILIAVAILATAPAASAQSVPGTISFVARLASNGVPVTGTHDLQLDLFDAPTGGASKWTEDRPTLAVPSDGVVFLDLGTLTTLDSTILDGTSKYLEITIDGTKSSARVLIESTPYAIRAGVCGDSEHLQSHPLTDLQLRLQSGCSSGQSIQTINQDGSVTCEVDQNTTYTAGTGLALSGANVFSVDTGVIQARVGGTCAASSFITAIAGDGSVTCAPDATGTTFTAGTGLSLVGGVLSVDSTIQRTITGTCPAGQALQTIAEDGTATCEGNIANQSASAQTASFFISGTARSVLARTGSEAGTTDAPSVNLAAYDGVVSRRTSSSTSTTGNVIARTDVMTLIRDGTNGGLQVQFANLAVAGSAECTGLAANGAAANVVKEFNAGDTGPVALFADAAHVVMAHCILGTTGHTTMVTLHRAGQNATAWTGFVQSTFSQ